MTADADLRSRVHLLTIRCLGCGSTDIDCTGWDGPSHAHRCRACGWQGEQP